MKYLKCLPKLVVVAYERWLHMRVRLYCVFAEKIGVSFLITAILKRQSIIMLVHLYIGQLILNIIPLYAVLFCNESITFNSYNINLNLPNLSVSTVHVCSWIENKTSPT